jgi:peptidoglycan/LPS O-acetylase OafA/YrhL
MNQNNNPKNHYAALTGVRAVAAYSVFLVHYIPLPDSLKGTLLYTFFMEFHVGVNMFFVLSGFLIAHRYAHGLQFNFRNYLVNRVARIYPMFFLLTTGSFLVWFLKNPQTYLFLIKSYLLNISLLKSFFNKFKFSGIPQAWSLTVEETFYLLAPIIFWAIRKNRMALVYLPLVFIAIGGFLSNIPFLNSIQGFFESMEFSSTFTFFGRCIEFFVGIALAIFLEQLKQKFTFKGITYTSILFFFGIMTLMAYLRLNNYFNTSFYLIWPISTFLLPLLAIAPLYLGLLTEKTLLAKVLSSKIMVLLGKSSYVFYLIHMGVVYSALNHIVQNKMLQFIVLNLISIILFTYLEEPLNVFIRKKFGTKPTLCN